MYVLLVNLDFHQGQATQMSSFGPLDLTNAYDISTDLSYAVITNRETWMFGTTSKLDGVHLSYSVQMVLTLNDELRPADNPFFENQE